MYVVIAKYSVRPGEEEAVGAALQVMTPLSRAEPGCVAYQAHRSLDNPSIYVLYEAYVDEEAYKAHAETAHFKQYVIEEAVPRLVSREREFFETLA